MTRTAFRRRLLTLALASALAVAGCGGDDEPEQAAHTTSPTTQGTTAPATSDTTTEESETTEETKSTEEDSTSDDKGGEDKPGGGGDEEGARTEVRLVGSGSKVRPARVSVAPFIGIRVFLKTNDGHQYFVTFGNTGGFATANKTTQFDLDGLRPGKSYEGRYFVDGKSLGPVTITATNEPGP